MLSRLRRTRIRRALAERLLSDIVARARAPIFYKEFGVSDTIDGRFDLTALHAWMVLERLGKLGSRALQQSLTDAVFTSFDEGLRELGAGDIGIGRRMKKMADAFYGRCQAYRAARDHTELSDAILRNVFRGDSPRSREARALAEYVGTARSSLSHIDPENGALDFGPLPTV